MNTGREERIQPGAVPLFSNKVGGSRHVATSNLEPAETSVSMWLAQSTEQHVGLFKEQAALSRAVVRLKGFALAEVEASLEVRLNGLASWCEKLAVA